MFKGIFAPVVALMLVCTLSAVSFAETDSIGSAVQPRYSYTHSFSETLTVSNETALNGGIAVLFGRKSAYL